MILTESAVRADHRRSCCTGREALLAAERTVTGRTAGNDSFLLSFTDRHSFYRKADRIWKTFFR